jgi:alkylation response protein AidB-like acyl-CoA dehydrogenase
MDFSLSEEQTLLQDSVEKYIRDNCNVERHRQLNAAKQGFDKDAWQKFAELGWLSVPFSEAQGGFGGGAVDVMVICETLGKALVREPILSTVVTGGSFLRHGGNKEQQQKYIPAIIDGSSQWAFAFAEKSSGYDMAAIETTAEHGDGFILTGEKIAVLNGEHADHLIVSAKTANGVSVFIVDADSVGVSREGFATVDGSRGANIRFNDVVVPADNLLSELDSGLMLIQKAVNDSIIAMGAEALGAMQSLLDTTVEYTKTRKQFGQPIGKFQALQHRMADMYLKVEETRSLLFNAVIQMDAGTDQIDAACSALKVKICEAGKFVSQESIQLHGGIGMTDELIVGHHFKRLMLLGMLYGDEGFYLQRFTTLAA